MANGKFSWFTLAGLAVVGSMAYVFFAPKLLGNKTTVAVPAVPAVPAATVQGALPQPLPNNMAPVMPVKADLDMNFAGVTFAENVPGLSYGFPLAGV